MQGLCRAQSVSEVCLVPRGRVDNEEKRGRRGGMAHQDPQDRSEKQGLREQMDEREREEKRASPGPLVLLGRQECRSVTDAHDITMFKTC